MEICPDEGTKSPLMSLISVDLPLAVGQKADHPAGSDFEAYLVSAALPKRLLTSCRRSRVSDVCVMKFPPFWPKAAGYYRLS